MHKERVLSVLPALLLFISSAVQGQAPVDVTPLAPTVTVAAEMALAPSDCGLLADALPIDPLIPHAIGTWPVWLSVPDAGEATKGMLFVPDEHYQRNRRLEGWWSTKAGWFVDSAYRGDVRVQITNLADDSPIYFDTAETDSDTIMALNPAEPGGFVEGLDDWAFFPSIMWASKAGCYRLQAEWDGGMWQQVIAVGNIP